MNRILDLSLADFLSFIKTINYGYTDENGIVHTGEDYDFVQNPYSFSSPETVIENNCAWCWDICELIRLYCIKNEIPVSVWFYEYQDEIIHQTHTQCFIKLNDLWYPVPDNSDPHDFSEFEGKGFFEVTSKFQEYFKEFIRYLAKGRENDKAFLFREYNDTLKEGMTDDEVLQVLRGR